MPGFGPVASEPVASIPESTPSGIQVAEQAAAVSYVLPGVIVADQAAAVAYHQPGLIVVEQSAAIVYLPGKSRRQYYLM